MKIQYGTAGKKIDVTEICIEKMSKDGIISIPWGDNNRARYFTDPVVGIHKKIFPYGDGMRSVFFTDPIVGVHKKIFVEIDEVVTEYDEYVQLKINTLTNEITTLSDAEINAKINHIHSTFKLKHGSFNDELPEQKMAVRYLSGKEKVLEIGGNIGRNSLVIASILEDDTNFVSLESDTHIAVQLKENRDANAFHFHIESAALSNRKLMQKGWITTPSEKLEPGHKWVNTISLANLKSKYNIEFDTLVLDCEGALYFILKDMPELLNGIQLIIMENDYFEISHKKYVDEVLKKNNFHLDYVETGGWGPCYYNFFEVWKR